MSYLDIYEARNKGLVQLYEWSFPSETIETVNGNMRAEDWLHAEQERISSDRTRTAEIFQNGGELSLFVDPIY